MRSRARHYSSAPAAAPAAGPATKSHAKAEVRKKARQRYERSQGLQWLKIAAGLVAVLLVAMLGLSFLTTGYGKLSAQSTSYAFGDVPWRGGFVTTKFPLNVEGDTTVNDIQST